MAYFLSEILEESQKNIMAPGNMKSAMTKTKVARKGKWPALLSTTKNKRYYQSRKKHNIGKRTTDFGLHPKQHVPQFDVKDFWRNRRRCQRRQKPCLESLCLFWIQT